MNNTLAETVLVTGTAGFLGSHLCEALLLTGARQRRAAAAGVHQRGLRRCPAAPAARELLGPSPALPGHHPRPVNPRLAA